MAAGRHPDGGAGAAPDAAAGRHLHGVPSGGSADGGPGAGDAGTGSTGAEHGGHAAVPPAVYWRRRAVALAVGIGLLTILVWAVNGTLSSGATATPGGHAGSSPGHGHGGPGGGGAGYGGSGHGGSEHGGTGPGGTRGGGHGGAGAGAAASPSVPSTAPAGAAGGSGPASPSPDVPAPPSGSPSAAPAGGAPDSGATPRADQVPACGPGDVALSLFTPKYWYERAQLPQFVVAAASASGRPCRFNMGARYVAVVVNYGTERIWSSADCTHGASSRGVVLTREHPAVSWITWNRRTSVPGCRPAGHSVKGATYTVTAVSGRLRSQGMVIVLDAPGLSVP